MKFDIRWVDDQLLSCTACTFDACHFVSLDVTSYCPRNPSLGTRLLASYMKMISRNMACSHDKPSLRPDAISGEENCWDMLRYKAAPRDFSSSGWNHDNHVYVECWGISFVMFHPICDGIKQPTSPWQVRALCRVKHPCDAPAKDSTVMVEVAHTSTTSPTVSLSVLLSTSVHV